MANAYEMWSEQNGSKAANDGDLGVRAFQITGATSESDCYTADLILTNLSNLTGKVPVLNEEDPRNTRRKVNSLRVESIGLNLMKLIVGYAIPTNGGSFSGTENNPLTQPVRWSWQRSKTVEPVDRDYDGNPIVNSNRDPFTNSPQRTFTQRILEARRYEATYPYGNADTYEDKVNSVAFSGPQGYTPATGTVKCNIITAVGEYTEDSPYVEVLYQFEIRPDGWRTRQLDEGTKGRDSTGAVLPLYHTNGDKITSPVLLNGLGNPRDDYSHSLGNPTGIIVPVDGTAPTGAEVESTADATFLRYKIYGTADLNNLGL